MEIAVALPYVDKQSGIVLKYDNFRIPENKRCVCVIHDPKYSTPLKYANAVVEVEDWEGYFTSESYLCFYLPKEANPHLLGASYDIRVLIHIHNDAPCVVGVEFVCK